MTDVSTQFIAMLKEENALEAMQVIKAALSERARAEVAKTQTEVAGTFKLTEKAAESNNIDTENDNADADGKSDADSVGNGKENDEDDK